MRDVAFICGAMSIIFALMAFYPNTFVNLFACFICGAMSIIFALIAFYPNTFVNLFALFWAGVFWGIFFDICRREACFAHIMRNLPPGMRVLR